MSDIIAIILAVMSAWGSMALVILLISCAMCREYMPDNLLECYGHCIRAWPTILWDMLLDLCGLPEQQMKSMPPQKPGRSKQDYATPMNFMKALEARFGAVVLDLAASETNRKAPLWLGLDKGVDSLQTDWKGAAGNGLCFLNPPFSNIAPWAKKCYLEGERGCKILFLVPASVDSNWWKNWVHNKAYVHILNGRITFEGCEDPYIKGLALIQYGYGLEGYGIWSWDKSI